MSAEQPQLEQPTGIVQQIQRGKVSPNDETSILQVRLMIIVPLGFVLPLILLLLGYPAVALAAFLAGVALLLITYSGVALRQRMDTYRVWTFYALADAVVIWLMSFVLGTYFNVFLIIAIVEVARIYRQARLVVITGLLVAATVALEGLLAGLANAGGTMRLPLIAYAEQPGFAAAAYALTAACVGLSLSTFIDRYTREIISYERVQQTNAAEMHVAHEIQSSLMSPRELQTSNWQIAAISIPARDVGGDFYEYIPYFGDVNSVGGIAIGDVSGKGIPAALQMAVVRTIFRIEARRRILPAETLNRVNQSLLTEMPLGMVTLLYAFVEPKEGVMHFANAGHNYPILLNGTVRELKLAGLPLGIYDETEYEEQSVPILPGNTVIFYTDGVVEAQNKLGEIYGFPRLLELVGTLHDHDPKGVLHEIMDAVRVFVGEAEQTDDITVVVLQHSQVKQ